MNEPENQNIKSELLIKYWNVISDTFFKILEASKTERNNSSSFTELRGMYNFENVVKILIKEWESLYPKFVLNEIEKDISGFIFQVQTEVYEKINSDAFKYPVVDISYDVMDRFSLSVEPNEYLYPYNEYKNSIFNFELTLKSNQFLLVEIFEHIWNEIGLSELHEFESDFYLESEKSENGFFIDFFARQWNLSKDITNSKIFGVLINSEENIIYSLEDNIFISENRSDYIEFLNKKGFKT